MRTFLASLLFVSLGFSANAQGPGFLKNTDVQFGAGYAFLGTGDFTAMTFEAGFTKKWNRLLSSSISANAGHADGSWLFENTFFAADAKAWFSPFGNDGKHNFKAGAGISLAYTTHTYLTSAATAHSGEVNLSFATKRQTTPGLLFSLGHEYRLTDRSLVGFEASYHQYRSGYNILGAAIKFGFYF